MPKENDVIMILFSRDEAWEILARCLASSDPDTPAIRSAMQKLARVVGTEPQERAS
jgi:hypothetical protein